MVRILEKEDRLKGGDSVINLKSDEPFHSADPDKVMHKPTRMRNNLKSVWTEQDSVYGDAGASRLRPSKDYSFPTRESPAQMRVEIPDGCQLSADRGANSSRVDDIETD